MSTASVELILKFISNISYLHIATRASRLLCETIRGPNLSERFVDEVELAVSEACTNAIRHAAAADASSMVIVHFRVEGAELVIEVSDQGAGFDLEAVPPPKFEQHPEGGYGLFIIRTVMNEVRYARGPEMNTLTMIKDLSMKGEVPS